PAADGDYEAWLGQSTADGPWGALAQEGGDEARNVAMNFVSVTEAQRDARAAAEGVGFVVSLPASGERHHAAAWLDLFAAAAGKGASPNTLALSIDEARPSRLVALYRPAEGEDLA